MVAQTLQPMGRSESTASAFGRQQSFGGVSYVSAVSDKPAGPSEDAWFASSISPEKASVKAYIFAAPKGMTNAPRNPQVREDLRKQLNEEDVQLEPEVWPPPMPASLAPPSPMGGTAIRYRWQLGSVSRQPSCPAVFGGNCSSPSYRRPPGAGTKSMSPKRPVPTSPAKGEATSPKKEDEANDCPADRKRWIYSAGFDRHEEEYTVLIEKLGNRKIGIAEVSDGLVAVPERGTLFERWNLENPEAIVKHGDRIMEINTIRNNMNRMMRQLRRKEAWEIKLAKVWSPTVDSINQSHGSPTAMWRNHNRYAYEGEPLSINTTRPKSAASDGAAAEEQASGRRASKSKPAIKEKSQSTDAWEHPDEARIRTRVMTEEEFRNAKLHLKGQAGLHAAAMSDVFRFAADVSRGAPLVIEGAGVASGMPSEIWASDGSNLVAFHSSALRIVNPSKLRPVEEHAGDTRHRRKKGELDLGDSSSFEPKYPIDTSLKTLRALKKEWYPEACRTEQEIAKEKKDAEVREVAEQAKAIISSLALFGRPKTSPPVDDFFLEGEGQGGG